MSSLEDRAIKAHEMRTRRLANSAGYRLIKYRSRNEDAPNYGQFNLIDLDHGGAVFNNYFGASLEEVEEYLLR